MSTFEIIMAIINVAALIIVPIAAVFIGQKLQDRNQKRKDKMEIFRVLMMNRGIGWTADTVRALNIIDVVFSDNDSVRARWRGCYVYCAPFFWRPPTPHVLAALRPP